MKRILIISVLLNAGLLGGAVFLWMHPRTVTIPAPPTPAVAVKVPAQEPSQPIVQTVVAPFHWTQFMPANGYRAFVENLRAAGCPEATVEDIVRGNTGRAYAMMRERLGVDETQPGPWSAQAEAQMVAYFLGQAPDAVQAPGIAETPAALAAAEQNDQGTAMLAAFLQNADLTTPGMTVEQAQETENMRQGLLAQISAASQAQNNHANTPSASASENTASSQSGGDNSQTSLDNQLGTDSSPTAQNGTGDQRQFERSPAAQASIEAEERESILAGLFGSGAAAQYDQYQGSQQ